MQDFEDEEAMFEHLNRSDTQPDMQSQPETFEDNFSQKGLNLHYAGDLSEKVSFNLENVSHIKHNESRIHQHKNIAAVMSSNNNSTSMKGGHQFSVHKQSNASLSELPLSSGTQGTARNTKLKHNMMSS